MSGNDFVEINRPGNLRGQISRVSLMAKNVTFLIKCGILLFLNVVTTSSINLSHAHSVASNMI